MVFVHLVLCGSSHVGMLSPTPHNVEERTVWRTGQFFRKERQRRRSNRFFPGLRGRWDGERTGSADVVLESSAWEIDCCYVVELRKKGKV